MRNLPAGLAAAQAAPTVAPVISAVLRARRGSVARLDPTDLYNPGGTATLPATAVQMANGNVVRAVISGGTVFTQVYPASPSSTWGAFPVNLGACYTPPAGLGIALTALGNALILVFPSDATHIAVYFSSDGSTWGLLATLANTGTITDLACAYATSGDILVVSADNAGLIRAFPYYSGSFHAAVTLTPAGATFINSIAATYGGSDWFVLFGWQTANLALLGSAIFGDGGLQTAHTWSAVSDVLGAGAASGDVPLVTGFAWGGDGGHAILVEQWAIAGGYTNNQCYAMECSSWAAFQGGLWTEPAPFPRNEANGTDLTVSQAVAGRYVAAGYLYVATLAPPADVDVSSRVVAIDYQAAHHSGSLVLLLDNSDQALTSLATSRNTIGLRLDLSLGYTVSGTPSMSPFPQRWVVKVEDSWVQGRHLVTLTCHDGWQLLHQLSARREAQFGTSLGLPALTVDQLIHWLCARAGIDYTPGSSILRNRTPDYHVLPGHSFGTLMLELLDWIEGWLLMTDSGASVIPLSTSDSSTYAFGGAGQHPVLQVFHTQELQPANLITVYSGMPDAITAQAFDAADANLLGRTAHEHTDTQLETANAQAVANALQRKAQVSAPNHSFICLPQVAQELGDVIAVTDPLTGVAYIARVQAFTLKYDRDKGEWQQTFTTSAV
jgi:hypothetical protein